MIVTLSISFETSTYNQRVDFFMMTLQWPLLNYNTLKRNQNQKVSIDYECEIF